MKIRSLINALIERLFYSAAPLETTYSKPQLELGTKSIVVLVPFFNATSSPLRATLLKRFLVSLSLHCPHVPVLLLRSEQGSADEKRRFKRSTEFAQVTEILCTSPDILWQKEVLLNLGLEWAHAEGFENVACLDADVEIEDPYWPERACQELRTHHVVQLFSRATQEENSEGTRGFTKRGVAEAMLENPSRGNKGVATGLAWAARTDWLRRRRFFEYAILGGGDSAFYAALLRKYFDDTLWMDLIGSFTFFRNLPRALMDKYLGWVSAFPSSKEFSVGFLKGNLRAYFHGAQVNRQKSFRYLGISLVLPERDLAKTASGMWMWTPQARQEQRDAAQKFFRIRDSI